MKLRKRSSEERERYYTEKIFKLTAALAEARKGLEKADSSLCENIIDELNADIDWMEIDGEAGLKETLKRVSNENWEILNGVRAAIAKIEELLKTNQNT